MSTPKFDKKMLPDGTEVVTLVKEGEKKKDQPAAAKATGKPSAV